MNDQVPVALVVVLPLFRPFTCNWIGVPGAAVPLIATSPAATASVNRPKGSMTKDAATSLPLMVSVSTGVATRVGISTNIGVAKASVAVIAGVVALIAGDSAMPDSCVLASVGSVTVSCAMGSVIDGVVVKSTTGVRAVGSSIACPGMTACGHRSPTCANKPVPSDRCKKAKRSPNHPKPTPTMSTKLRRATSAKRSTGAKPRCSSSFSPSPAGMIACH